MDRSPFDAWYRAGEHWRYRDWLYLPLVRTLAAKAKLPPGATILDAGCGQGWFTHALTRLGFRATGADLSEEGIRYAQRKYGNANPRFEVRDLSRPNDGPTYDAVFTRSFGLYGVKDFEKRTDITATLLTYVKPGGTLIFVHHSKPWNRVCTTWCHHTLPQVQRHFSGLPAETAFVVRPEMFVLRGFALTRVWSACALAISRLFRVGGEMVAIVRRPFMAAAAFLVEISDGVLSTMA